MLCNDGLREGAKFSPGLASRLLCYLPLHKIWYGIEGSMLYEFYILMLYSTR